MFDNIIEWDLELHVGFGVDTKHAVKGSGTMLVQLELGGMLEVKDVIWVPKLRRSLLLVSMIDKKGFVVAFLDGRHTSDLWDLSQVMALSLELERETCIG